jgi:hypothetical protein
MNRGNAGVIGTLVTPSSTVATGVFSLNQLQVAAKNGTWPPFVVVDPYFNYVTMLLPGNGTNGAQNNTFLDSSANNFTITRNGNTTQGTVSPYGNNWSNYFGSNNYISAASNAAFAIGTGDFTVEGWVYPDSAYTTYNYIFAVAVNGGLVFYVTGGNLVVRTYNGVDLLSSSTIPALNTWTHVAATRSGTTLRIFVNGVLTASTTNSTNFPQGGALVGNDGTNVAPWLGYISNFRLVKGTAVYTTNFTPPTAPLTAITDTSLLTCQSNRFIDNSSNNFAITRNGNVSVQRFSPFNPTASYAPSVDGGSGYFDGSGDALSSTTSFEASTSQTTFTIEGWIYPTTFSTLINIIGGMGVLSGDSKSIAAEVNTSGQVALYWFDGAIKRCTGNSVMQLRAWNYFAIVVTSNAIAIYVNKTTADTLTGTTTLTNRTQLVGLGVGAYYNNNLPSYFFNGSLSNIRYSTIARTISAVPTAPVTSDTNTRWLLNFTNAGIIDNAEMNNLETVGNAQISTAQSKFGGGSMLFDGNGDGLFVPPSQNPNFGSGNFTIELWIYYNSLTGAQTIISNGYTTPVTNGWLVQTGTGDGKFNFYKQTSPTTVVLVVADGGSAMSAGVWYHMAIVRNGTTTTIYRNGTSVGSATDTTTYTATAANFYVGGGTSTGFNGGFFNGYIDDLRITRGVARYTANFTPPITPFPTA